MNRRTNFYRKCERFLTLPLNEINLYITTKCNQDCLICFNAYKQFLYCSKLGDNQFDMNSDHINKIINILITNNISRINILGGNIFLHSNIKKIIYSFNHTSILKNYYVFYLDLGNHRNFLRLIDQKSAELNILVNFPVNKSILKNVCSIIDNIQYNSIFNFIIDSEKDLIETQNLISELAINNYYINPFFNTKNISFFEKEVFIKTEELKNIKPPMKDIFMKSKINLHNYGKVFILCNGDIFTDINNRKIGNLSDISLHEVIYKEITKENNWFKTRNKVEPCKNCHYNCFCPSISNYENVIGKNNLCHIWKE